MGHFLDNLKFYFENTSQEEIDKEWEEIASLNEVGPDVIEYADFYKNINIEIKNNGEDKI